MSRVSYVNGDYCEHKESFVHVEDRGYQFADGVYEVFCVLGGKIVDYEGHITRLYRSLNELRIASPNLHLHSIYWLKLHPRYPFQIF